MIEGYNISLYKHSNVDRQFNYVTQFNSKEVSLNPPYSDCVPEHEKLALAVKRELKRLVNCTSLDNKLIFIGLDQSCYEYLYACVSESIMFEKLVVFKILIERKNDED